MEEKLEKLYEAREELYEAREELYRARRLFELAKREQEEQELLEELQRKQQAELLERQEQQLQWLQEQQIEQQRKQAAFEERLKEYYMRALTKGAADVAYGRVMLLGPAGVGKTCLRRGLMNLPFDPKTNSTILADVTSVKPTVDTTVHDQPQHGAARSLSHEWLTHGWSEVSEEDEINELAQLMVLAGTDLKASKDELIEPASDEASSTDKSETTGSSLSLKSLEESNVVQKAIEKAMQLIEENDVHLECLPLFHLWDCGGQPVFLEVLPIFLTARTIYLQLFNAAIDLTQPWRSVYNIEGRQFEDTETNMSTLQMMGRWIALICSHLWEVDEAGVDPGYPRIIPIGTRGDELNKQGKKPEDVIAQVQRYIEGKAALYNILKQPLIIDNTTSGNADDEDPGYAIIRKEIFDITFSKLKKNTPITWILYRKLLQLLTLKPFYVNVISLHEAEAVGQLIAIDQIHSVLKFYHQLGVLLYYPDIKSLEQKIILNPKWFVESLGQILTIPGAKEEQFEDKAEWELLRSKGILVQKLYTKVWRECQGVEPEEFIELLTHFQLAVEVKTEEYFNKSIKQFFVPGVLPYASPFQQMNKEENPSIKAAATLHIIFNGSFVIPGFFTRLSTSVLERVQTAHPELELYFKKGIYHNQVTYKVKSMPCIVTLKESNDAIEVAFLYYSNQSEDEIQKCCISLKALCQVSCEKVETCLQSLHGSINKICSFKLKIVCQAAECHQGKCQVHYLTDDEPYDAVVDGSVHTLVVCDNDEMRPRDITLEEAYWYNCRLPLNTPDSQLTPQHSEINYPQDDVDGNPAVSIPTVSQVYRLLRGKSACWNDFGRELGVDHNFRKGLLKSTLSDEDKLEEILIKWSESKCSEVSWDTILQMLKDLTLEDLVQILEEKLKKYMPR